MKIFTALNTFVEDRNTFRAERGTVGFVPTMGALHAGHISLIQRARRENDFVIVSLFVNPTQFDDRSDFSRYPKTIDRDFALAKEAGCDQILLPTEKEIYADDYRFKMTESQFSRTLCGGYRPGHFDGVLTVVLKLFNIVQPDRAYFGEKDYQQLRLIDDMVQSLFLAIDIVACPTVREADGLAMSSRNVRLGTEERERAPIFFRTLKTAESAVAARAALEAAGFEVDYVVDQMFASGLRRLGAVRIGGVRLIDNVPLGGKL